MAKRMSKRQQAIRRRNIFLTLCVIFLVAMVALIIVIGKNLLKSDVGNTSSTDTGSVVSSDVSIVNSDTSSENTDSKVESETEYNPNATDMVNVGGVELDANFRRVLLVNGDNPLPDNYDADVRQYLVEVNAKYRNNNNVTQLHKDIIPYVEAMVAAAQSEGVDLRVWSPFRSYNIQNQLFQKQVERVKATGLSGTAAENKAATVVARPGTSEHNTGLCADFNMASDKFEGTKMFEWMCENAENYGFILRYPKSKQNITGVIYESWHWRFVGINTAKEMNELGLTLEEYVELKHINNSDELQ